MRADHPHAPLPLRTDQHHPLAAFCDRHAKLKDAEHAERGNPTNEDAHKREADFAGVEAVLALEDERERGEKGVDDTVCERAKKVEKSDDGLRVEYERTNEEHHHDFASAHILLHDLARCIQLRVPGTPTKALRAAVKYIGRRGLREEEEKQEPWTLAVGD